MPLKRKAQYPIETETEESGQFDDGFPIPVHVESTSVTQVKPTAPDYGSCQNYEGIGQIGVNQPTLILPRRLRRYKAFIIVRTVTAATVWFNSNPNALTPAQLSGVRLVIGGATTNSSFPEWDSQQPLYAISTVGDTVIMVVDSSFASE